MSRENLRQPTSPAARRDAQEVAIARRLLADPAGTIDRVTVVGLTRTWVVTAGERSQPPVSAPVDRATMVRLVRVPTVAYPAGGLRLWQRIWYSLWQRFRAPSATMMPIDDLATALPPAPARGTTTSQPGTVQTTR